MRSLMARNQVAHGPGVRRGRTGKQKYQESAVDDHRWTELEAAFVKLYGRDTGRELFALLRQGEHDIVTFSEVFMGVVPLRWQQLAWDEGLMKKPYNTAQLGNGSGKTESVPLFTAKAAVYRHWCPEWWGDYRMIHHGPKETHALQAHKKFVELYNERSRAQAYKARRPDGTLGWLYRPFLLKPFITFTKHDNKQHEGIDFFGGAAALTFRSTAFQAEGSDGTDPYWISEDELRHEMYFQHVLEAIYLPRSLRATGMRLWLPFTQLDALPELLVVHERGMSGKHKDWHSLAFDLDEANPTVEKEAKERIDRNVSRRRAVQIKTGRDIQPVGAKFSGVSVALHFDGTEEPEWLSYLGDGVCDCESCRFKAQFRVPIKPLMERIRERCEVCQKIASGDKAAVHHNTQDRRHPVVASCDPAASARKDEIAFEVWDCHPPKEMREQGISAETVYAEVLEPGTRIQHVTKHAVAIALHIGGECLYDHGSGLGHAIDDLSVDVGEAELVPVTWDAPTKDKDLDYLGAVIDHAAARSPFQLETRVQMTTYRRADAKLTQDRLMAKVLVARAAKPYLPEFTQDRTEAVSQDEEELAYTGFGDEFDPFSLDEEADPMMAMAE